MAPPLTHLFPLLSLLLIISVSTTSAQVIKPTKIIDDICKQVSNYTFCVEAIYSDFRAPAATNGADLAQITYFYAYNTVANTSNEITTLRKDPKNRNDKPLVKALLHCRANYRQADKTILSAFDLIDSEIYWTLKDLMTKVERDATDCENGFTKIGKASPLSQQNKVLEEIAEICIVVANLLNS